MFRTFTRLPCRSFPTLFCFRSQALLWPRMLRVLPVSCLGYVFPASLIRMGTDLNRFPPLTPSSILLPVTLVRLQKLSARMATVEPIWISLP
jgi:hypothetical protein